MELRRTKNLATIIAFPIVKNDGTLISSATGLDSEIDGWSDGAAPDGFTDCANEATEIGTTGQYYLALTAEEMNADYVIVQIKSSTTGAVTQTILINTTLQRVEVVTNGDKTGYELATAPPSAAEIRAEMDESSMKLANLDTPISTRASSLTALSSAIWTEEKAGYLDAAVSSIIPGTPVNVTVEHTNISTSNR
jgi:hypothetical protein